MLVRFEKFQGTGNDFIIIDSRELKGELSTNDIKFLCNRQLGVGADGLMLLKSANECDFEMKYFNSDGYEGTMCGNGGRCIAAYAKKHSISNDDIIFKASDGIHNAKIISVNGGKYLVKLKLSDVTKYKVIGNDYLIDTGSPHYIIFVDNIDNIDVFHKGAKIRYDKNISENGVNVNFVKIFNKELFVRTYERGVEAETLSCGTGVAASTIAYYIKTGKQKEVNVKTKGGQLSVSFDIIENKFVEIFLLGLANFVFSGEVEIF